MLQTIREMFLASPEKLAEALESFGFAHVKIYRNYISFGRDETSSPKSLVIFLNSNSFLYVKDYPRSVSKELYSYVMEEKNLTFVEVLDGCARVLGLDRGDFYRRKPAPSFGGIFKRRKKDTVENLPIDEGILQKYENLPNARFLRDGIGLEAQRFFEIRFDRVRQNIIIPLRREDGALIGIKARINREPDKDEQKYFYEVPCSASLYLYGMAQNYTSLACSDTVCIFEAEKSVMQAWQMGFYNAVALGSSSLSKAQARLLASLPAQRYVFLMDRGLPAEAVQHNCETLKDRLHMRTAQIQYWNCEPIEGDKSSPTDYGRDTFLQIMEKELIQWN